MIPHTVSPAWIAAFLDEIEAVCQKYGLSISHEDSQGAFEIEPFNADAMAWLRAADIDPAALGQEPPGEIEQGLAAEAVL